jgi:hypothetical protein
MDDELERQIRARLETRFSPSPHELVRVESMLATLPATNTSSVQRRVGGALLSVAVVIALVVAFGSRLPLGLPLGGESSVAQPSFSGASASSPAPASILLMRTYSGPFSAASERTVPANPDLIVYSSGVVVARRTDIGVDLPGQYRSLTIEGGEWSTLVSSIEQVGALSVSIDPQSAHSCFDGVTAIFTIRLATGRDEEIVAPCLDGVPGLATPDPAVYGRSIVALQIALVALETKVGEAGAMWGGPVPTVKIAPFIGG